VNENIERDRDWLANIEVVPGHPELLHVCEQFGAERLVKGLTTEAINGENNRVPARQPAELGPGLLHAREALGDLRVVCECNRTTLSPKRDGGKLPGLFHRLGVGPA
jgi:hypothetical protein